MVASLRALLVCFVLFCSCTPARAPSAATTRDPRIVRIAREELDRAVAEWEPDAAVVVVLDPATGSILAEEGRDHGKDDPSLASRQAYVTGSTLKTFIVAAALEAGTIDAQTRVDCATRHYPQGDLSDPSPHGMLSITEVLEVSSNVGASRIYDTFGLDRLLATLRALHFDPPRVDDGASLSAGVLAAGELMEATPMQMAAAYAAVFHGGLYLPPTFVEQTAKPERVMSSKTAQAMLPMLDGVVSSDLGTGSLACVEGLHVVGKTGTGALSGDRNYASFVGTVLERSPSWVVLVGLVAPKNGGNGRTAAAPVFARIVRRLVSDP